MKYKSLIIIALLFVGISISSCASRKKHRDCDCPSFGYKKSELLHNDQRRI